MYEKLEDVYVVNIFCEIILLYVTGRVIDLLHTVRVIRTIRCIRIARVFFWRRNAKTGLILKISYFHNSSIRIETSIRIVPNGPVSYAIFFH